MAQKLVFRQEGQEYMIYTPQMIPIAHLSMPRDGQYARDVRTLTQVGRAMAERWDVPIGKI